MRIGSGGKLMKLKNSKIYNYKMSKNNIKPSTNIQAKTILREIL
jgi:hypothetical protein